MRVIHEKVYQPDFSYTRDLGNSLGDADKGRTVQMVERCLVSSMYRMIKGSVISQS